MTGDAGAETASNALPFALRFFLGVSTGSAVTMGTVLATAMIGAGAGGATTFFNEAGRGAGFTTGVDDEGEKASGGAAA